MKILGIDWGEKRLGLAITGGEIARPLRVEIKNQKSKIKIKELCERENIEKIVIGMPEGKLVKKIQEFGQQIKKLTGLPVEFFDETLTSEDAIRKMIEAGTSKKKRREFLDAISAALILQGYLESKKKNT